MRSTAILALAAVSGFAFAEQAEQADTFKAVKSLIDNEVKSDFAASAGGSVQAAGNVGTQFLPSDKEGSSSSSGAAKNASDASDASSMAARDATQQVYGQCGGGKYSGPTNCAGGSKCYRRDDSYSQCLPLVQQAYGQCAGNSYFGTNACAPGSECKKLRADYSQCIPSGGKVGAKAVAPQEEADMMAAADPDPKHTAEGQDEDPVHASMSAAMAEGYKTDAAAPPAYTSEAAPAPPAYTSEAAATSEAPAASAPASYMTEDTMMAMPTEEAKPTEMESSMMAEPTTSMMMSAEPTPYVPVAKTSSSVMYGSNNATQTAGSPAASGTGMGAPKPYEGAASGLMVPSMVFGAGMAVFFGMVL
jgi:hypothetical protein